MNRTSSEANLLRTAPFRLAGVNLRCGKNKTDTKVITLACSVHPNPTSGSSVGVWQISFEWGYHGHLQRTLGVGAEKYCEFHKDVFFFRIPAKAEAQNVTEKWHVAYHGTHPGVLRKILDSADLLMTGDCLLAWIQVWQWTFEPTECGFNFKPIPILWTKSHLMVIWIVGATWPFVQRTMHQDIQMALHLLSVCISYWNSIPNPLQVIFLEAEACSNHSLYISTRKTLPKSSRTSNKSSSHPQSGILDHRPTRPNMSKLFDMDAPIYFWNFGSQKCV